MSDKPYRLVEIQNHEGGLGWYEYKGGWATADEAFAALQEAFNDCVVNNVEYDKLTKLGVWYSQCTGYVVVYNENLS